MNSKPPLVVAEACPAVRPLNRREVLLGLAAAPALLAGCGGGAGQPSASPVDAGAGAADPEPASAEVLSRARHFKPLEGDVFYVEHPFYGSLDAVMTPLEENHLDPGLEQFAVGFYLPSGSDLPEGTYRVTHHSGSSFDLYLQPGGVAVDGYDHHRAVFSHLPEELL